MISVLIAVRVVTVVIAIVATVIVWVFILLEVEKFPKIAHHASTFLFFFLVSLAWFSIPFLTSFSGISGFYGLLVLASILGLLTLLLLTRLSLWWLVVMRSVSWVASWSIGWIRLVWLFLCLLSSSLFLLTQLWSLCVLTVFRG